MVVVDEIGSRFHQQTLIGSVFEELSRRHLSRFVSEPNGRVVEVHDGFWEPSERSAVVIFCAVFTQRAADSIGAQSRGVGEFTVWFEHETAGVDGERLVRRVLRGYSRDEGDNLDGAGGEVYGVVVVGDEEAQRRGADDCQRGVGVEKRARGEE